MLSKNVIDLGLLHRRLGHANVADISEAVKKNRITGVQLSSVKINCKTCLKDKMSRKPFPRKSNQKTELLELIHMYVCGPFPVRSLAGAKYYLEFIDDNSQWCEIRFFKSKSEVLESTIEFISMVENQKGKRVKTLQSDNGGEYKSLDFDKYLKEHGITRRLTVPHNPEQNGKAERMNRTLLDTLRCLLFQANLPFKFWAEAANTANHIRNRLPSNSLKGKTPYETWTGKVPDVSQFRTFGCEVYYLDRDPGRNKLDKRGKEVLFLGYAEESKGFRVYSQEKNKVLISKDVRFFESEQI